MTNIIDIDKFKPKKQKLTIEQFEKKMAHCISEIESEWNYHCNNSTLNKYCQEMLATSKWAINLADLNLIAQLETKYNLHFMLSKKESLFLIGELEGFEYQLSATTEQEVRLINLLVVSKFKQEK